MQALMETIFDTLYLGFVLTIGWIMFTKSAKGALPRKFGAMALLLGAGDAFHLVPRVIALWGSGLEANAVPLGVGKLITSVTMTVFYLILYFIWRERYQITGRKNLTLCMLGLAALRIILCLLPQNDWLAYQQPLYMGILRNIPFAAMGVIVIVLFWQETRRRDDRIFRHMPLAVILSFAFYIPVVLFASAIPLIGTLMMPKTLAYVWIVLMGWRLYREKSA